jgi:hypothetical protein
MNDLPLSRKSERCRETQAPHHLKTCRVGCAVCGRLTGGIPLRCATCRCMRSGRAWLTRDDPRRDRLPRPIIRVPDAPRGRRAAVAATSTTLRFAVLLVRFIEAGYTALLERQANSHREFGVCGTFDRHFRGWRSNRRVCDPGVGRARDVAPGGLPSLDSGAVCDRRGEGQGTVAACSVQPQGDCSDSSARTDRAVPSRTHHSTAMVSASGPGAGGAGH